MEEMLTGDRRAVDNGVDCLYVVMSCICVSGKNLSEQTSGYLTSLFVPVDGVLSRLGVCLTSHDVGVLLASGAELMRLCIEGRSARVVDSMFIKTVRGPRRREEGSPW